MKNTLPDLNNYLFEQIERLSDDDLTDDQLDKELNKTKAITNIAGNIIKNASVMLDAAKHSSEYSKAPVPGVIGIEKNE